MLTMLAPGTKVLITRDVRGVPPEMKADGQIGVYEGDFPVSVSVHLGNDFVEYEYARFMQFNAQQMQPIPSIQEAIASGDVNWRQNAFYMVSDYPRIRLSDGSYLWGYECWWGVAEDAPPLVEAQAQTERAIASLRSMMQGEEE